MFDFGSCFAQQQLRPLARQRGGWAQIRHTSVWHAEALSTIRHRNPATKYLNGKKGDNHIPQGQPCEPQFMCNNK